jgi:beta-galactosidase
VSSRMCSGILRSGASANEERGYATRLAEGWEFLRSDTGTVQPQNSEAQNGWESVTLPHCFNAMNACDPEQAYFRGSGWYRTHIDARNPHAGGRTVLYFQGAGQTSTLWVGSTQVGKHKGGYDEFAFDITDTVSGATDLERVPVKILCDNSPDRDRVPSDLSDFCLYGGLYRHVDLLHLPAVSLDTVHILPVIQGDGSANIAVKGRLYNPREENTPCIIQMEIWSPQGQLIYRKRLNLATWKGFAALDQSAVDHPELWSPSSPALYRCRISISSKFGEMEQEERFGIRKIEFVEHGCFKLNGERLLLRGTQRHADHAGVAAAMTDAQLREEMHLIRAMGANFIRLAHYQQGRLVLELCDELGLMVWEEVPWCRAGIGGEAFRQNVRDQLTHMIEQHYNHVSIIFWGLGNEDDWPGEYPSINRQVIRSFMQEMNDLAHRLDDSRYTAFRRCDFARDIPDVYSPSIWAGWYRGKYREYEQALLQGRESVKRFIHMEWGADSHAGRHAEDPEAGLRGLATGQGTDERGLDYLKNGGEVRASSNGDWSETYACDLCDWYLKTQEKLDWLSGSAQWIFKDFASPLRGDNGIPRVNQKGMVERDLALKELYFLFQSYWAEKPMVHIYGHSWPVRWGKPGQKRMVRVYSNCERAELFLNGVSVGTKLRKSQDFPSAGLRWEVEFTPGLNHLRAVASRGTASLTDEVSLTYQTEPWGEPAELRLREKSRENGRITVEAKLFDSRGVLCLDAQNLVRFSVNGAGSLIDNLGTTRASREVQLANGRAEISLHAIGACRAKAEVQGIAPATCSLEVHYATT